MGVDFKSRKPCEWCGGMMRPRYYPTRGYFESERWERAGAFAKRRFCSRLCQNSSMASRRIYPEKKERNDEIWRLHGLGLSLGQIAAQVQITRSAVIGVLHRYRRKASGERVTLRELAERETAERAKPARGKAARKATKRDRGRTR